MLQGRPRDLRPLVDELYNKGNNQGANAEQMHSAQLASSGTLGPAPSISFDQTYVPKSTGNLYIQGNAGVTLSDTTKTATFSVRVNGATSGIGISGVGLSGATPWNTLPITKGVAITIGMEVDAAGGATVTATNGKLQVFALELQVA